MLAAALDNRETKMKTANNLVKALSESFDDSLSKPTDNRITAPILQWKILCTA